ncbi:unnamed protein product [Rhizoctonia solani]|uniref:Uncharacterized protein n=1 Tax=Rhizoctonia solani TaxID=456999 RepID=A0A8H3H5J1_9AGAM|nr:unnamed protein product [Rhizoctonia solani]
MESCSLTFQPNQPSSNQHGRAKDGPMTQTRLTFPIANAPKHKRTESSCKREGRKNQEGLKRAREDKKNSTKTRKTRRKEAEEDLLVKQGGESANVTLFLHVSFSRFRLHVQLKMA